MNKKLLPLALLGLMAAGQATAVTYTFKTIDGPGADATYPSDINDNGQVVGTYYDPITGSNPRTYHGFLYDGSTFKTLTVPDSGTTTAKGINNLGKIVGSYTSLTTPNDLGSHGFLYSAGTFATLDIPYSNPLSPRATTELVDINDNGQIAGNLLTCSLNQFGSCIVNTGAYLYSGGNFSLRRYGATAIAMNVKGDITGSDDYPVPGDYGFFLAESNQTLRIIKVPAEPPISKPISSWAASPSSINDLGQIVGAVSDPLGTHGFLYDTNQATIFNLSGADRTRASAINNNGQIVGSYSDSLGNHGFVKNGGTYTTVDIPGALNTAILKNNNKGQLIGYYQDSALIYHGFIATPVAATSKPTKERDCEKSGWRKFGFKNKGQCEKYFEKLKEKEEEDD